MMEDAASRSESAKRGRGRPRLQPTELQESTTVQALERGLMLLQLLSKCHGASLTDLSLQVGVPAPTAYRLLCTLQKREFVAFNDTTQLWSIGIEAFTVGSGFYNRANLVDASRDVMRKLRNDTGETANLAILTEGGYVTFLTQVESAHPIRAFHSPGTRGQVHCSGIGKALLAEFSREEAEATLRKTGLEQFTPKTLTQPSALFDDLQIIHQRGWSVDDEERYLGMRCIAAAIHDTQGEAIAGVSISGPTVRFADEALAVLGPRVRQAALDITRLMGGKAPNYEARRQAAK